MSINIFKYFKPFALLIYKIFSKFYGRKMYLKVAVFKKNCMKNFAKIL